MSDPFEETLRDWLAGRAVVDASPSLRSRIAAVPMAPSSSRRSAPRRWIMRLATASVVAAAVIAVGFWVLSLSNLMPLGPGASPLPTSPDAVGIRPGDGLALPTLRIEGWLLVAAVGVGLVFAARRAPRRWFPTWVRVLIVVTIVAGALAIGRLSTTVGVRSQGSWGPGLGWIGREDERFKGDTLYQPGPRSRFSFVIAIVNDGPVPVTVLGLARPDDDQYYAALVASGSQRVAVPWDGTIDPDPERVDPFRPVILWPGDMAAITVLGATGDCMAGLGDPSTGGTGYDSMPVVVGFLGFEWVDEVRLPSPAVITQLQGCQAQDPIEIP